MRSPNRPAILYILGFIISATLISMGLVFMRRGEVSTGAIMLVIALPLLLFAIRSLEQNPLSEDDFAVSRPFLIPGIAFLLSAGISISAVFNVTNAARTPQMDLAAIIEWLTSILFLIFGVLWVAKWKPTSARAVWEWINNNRVEFGMAAGILLASLIIRMIYLTDHPYPWSGDEASVGLDAVRILNKSITNWFDTSWSGQPNVSFLPTSLSILIFGRTIFAVKMVSVITGTLSVLVIYLLAREWFSLEIALIASGFLAAFPFHLQFSRIGVDNIIDSLMAPLAIWLLFRASRLRSMPTYLAAGIVSGLSIYTYVGTRLVVAMSVGTVIYIAIRQKDFIKTELTNLGAYIAGTLITAAPMAAFFIKRPDLFMTRLGQEGIFFNGWLASQVESTGQSAFKILLDQFSKTILVYFAQNAGSNFLNFDRPYLTILGAVFFLIGITVSLRYFFEQKHFILQMWFWSVIVLGGLLTMSPPANTRMVMTIPTIAIFIGLGISEISGVLLKLKLKKSWVYGLNVILVLALAVQNLTFYFGIYWSGRFFQDASGELGMETGMELNKLGEDYDLYLFGLPRVFAQFPTTDFLAPDNPKFDLNSDSLQELSLPVDRGAYIVAIPENEDLLKQVMKKYPGGTFETVKRKSSTEVLYYAYILAPQKTSP